MRTVDRTHIHASRESVFRVASDVARWPTILPHYRWVRFLERRGDGGVVEMAARRPFGPVAYPAWWVSEMAVDRARGEIRYRHIRGITTGMNVMWRLVSDADGVDITIVHEWSGPRWPLIGRLAADFVIGPVFVHGIASRTLAGLKRALEAQ